MSPHLTIILLGNTGVGKSASGNTILGKEAFVSIPSIRPVTKLISERTEHVFGNQISVIDTPGILSSEKQIKSTCQDVIASSSPILFLFVVKIDPTILKHKDGLENAIRVIGDEGFSRCYLLFTGGDTLMNRSVEDFISEDPQLVQLFERFAGRYHVFNNQNGDKEQVRDLLLKSGHLRTSAGSTEDRRIVLLSIPGDGKSSCGNTILGSDHFKASCSFKPVTTESKSISATVEERKVTVVDTPGFSAAALTPIKLYNEILTSIVEAGPGPHAFIIVVKISRITEANIKLFEMLPRVFGKGAPKYTVILFTHGDQLRDRCITELIQEDRCVSKLVSMCDGRYCVFDNTKTTNREQVRVLLGKIDQMVSVNKGHYTPEMFYEVQGIPVKVSVKVKEFLEWFRRLLDEIDHICKNSSEYVRLDVASVV